MRSALRSVKARFDHLDRGADRTGWTQLPLAPLVWAAVMIGAAALTWNHSWQLRPEADHDLSWSAQHVLDGDVWRAATATVLTRDVSMIGSLLFTTCIYLWLLERLTSTPVALGAWVVGALWGFLGTTIFLWGGSLAGWDLATTTLTTSDYGPSGGTAAVAAVIVALMRHRLVTVVSVATLVIGSALHHEVADLEHLLSFTTTLLVAWLVLKRTRPVEPRPHR